MRTCGGKKFVYGIFPLDESGKIAGVYVGSSWNVEERIGMHRSCRQGVQTELHDMMRNNGYYVAVLDCFKPSAHNDDGNITEYYWINEFKSTGIKIFNRLSRKVGTTQTISIKFASAFPQIMNDACGDMKKYEIRNYCGHEFRPNKEHVTFTQMKRLLKQRKACEA